MRLKSQNKYPRKSSVPIKGAVNTSRTLGNENVAKFLRTKITKHTAKITCFTVYYLKAVTALPSFHRLCLHIPTDSQIDANIPEI